jgi:predicted nucleic acid-binding protein
MIPTLVDTNGLLSALQPGHPQHEIIHRALDSLTMQGFTLCIVPQNLYELWVVATRPREKNGLGLSATQATGELERAKAMFTLLYPPESMVYPTWERLVREYNISGKPSHDARIAAAMMVHGIRRVLTFDRSGFSRFPDIQAVHPAEIAA